MPPPCRKALHTKSPVELAQTVPEIAYAALVVGVSKNYAS